MITGLTKHDWILNKTFYSHKKEGWPVTWAWPSPGNSEPGTLDGTVDVGVEGPICWPLSFTETRLFDWDVLLDVLVDCGNRAGFKYAL